MGVKLRSDDVAFRMNLVTLNRKSDDEILMVSHSAGDISTGEAGQIVETIKQQMNIPGVSVYQGVAYRHLFVWNKGPVELETIPPHNVLDQNVVPYLNHTSQNPIPGIIRHSWAYLENHPVNVIRRERGLKQANSIWLWGQGKAPEFPLFYDRFGLHGGVISAVDLLKGIGHYVGFESIDVKGATGFLDTNYRGKAEGALKGLGHLGFLLVHVEAPDEAGHDGNIEEKILAIEAFDEKVVGTVLRGMTDFDDYRIMVASDHYTPICTRTHTSDPAPFAWAGKKELESVSEGGGFTEKAAKQSEIIFEKGHDLMSAFIGRS